MTDSYQGDTELHDEQLDAALDSAMRAEGQQNPAHGLDDLVRALDSRRLDWLDQHCAFVADGEYKIGPFALGELRQLADAGLAQDWAAQVQQNPAQERGNSASVAGANRASEKLSCAGPADEREATVSWGPPIPLPDGTYYRIGASTGVTMPAQPLPPARTLSEEDIRKDHLCPDDHSNNEDNGSCWICGKQPITYRLPLPPARTLSEEDIREIALQACDKAAYMNTEAHIKAVEDAIRTALERLSK